jgi:hypothetical protein
LKGKKGVHIYHLHVRAAVALSCLWIADKGKNGKDFFLLGLKQAQKRTLSCERMWSIAQNAPRSEL